MIEWVDFEIESPKAHGYYLVMVNGLPKVRWWAPTFNAFNKCMSKQYTVTHWANINHPN